LFVWQGIEEATENLHTLLSIFFAEVYHGKGTYEDDPDGAVAAIGHTRRIMFWLRISVTGGFVLSLSLISQLADWV